MAADPALSTPTSGYKTGEIIAHIPGEARAVTVQGNIAYVGFENELNIIDVTNKEQPVVLSQLTVSDIIRDIAVQEGIAYLTNSAGIEMVDVTVLENPHWLGVYAEESVRQLHLDESHIYLLTWYGLRILDATNTPNLTQVSAIDIEYAHDLDIVDDYAFILGDFIHPYYFYIIDISDPTQPYIEKIIDRFRNRRVYVTHTHILTVADMCSSTCFTYLSVVDLDWQTLNITGRGSHYPSYYSSGTQAVEANKMYAFAGKDIGLWTYNYIKEGLNRGPFFIEKFDVGEVWQIVAHDDYIYVSTTTNNYFYVEIPAEGGFYILPAPPLFNVYLPIVPQ